MIYCLSIAITSIQDIYDVGELLGQGNFGGVYIARKKVDNLQYAIKRIPLPFEQNKSSIAEREANALYSLQHENIVTIYKPLYTFKEGLSCKLQHRIRIN